MCSSDLYPARSDWPGGRCRRAALLNTSHGKVRHRRQIESARLTGLINRIRECSSHSHLYSLRGQRPVISQITTLSYYELSFAIKKERFAKDSKRSVSQPVLKMCTPKAWIRRWIFFGGVFSIALQVSVQVVNGTDWT